MWKILNQPKADDYVISTGKNITVKKFIETAFSVIGISLSWKGKGLKEVGYNKKNNKILVKIDKKYFRPLEVDNLLGKSIKTKKILNWQPKINLKDLATEMVKSDIAILKKKYNL